MKKLLWKLVLPLTVISFEVFTKWRYVFVEDGPNEVLKGFPFPYVCKGWHTSLSLHFFITELLLDILIYFSFWFFLVFVINKYIYAIKTHKIITGILLVFASLIFTFNILIASNPDTIFKENIWFKYQTIDEGFDIFKLHRVYPL